MPLAPQALFQQLTALVASTPDFRGGLTPETLTWLGRAYVLVSEANPMEALGFQIAMDGLGGAMPGMNVVKIATSVHRALAIAEAAAPAEQQGSFIAAGAVYTAFQVIAKVMMSAERTVLVVDPYGDDIAVREFIELVPENIPCRVLASYKEARAALLSTAQEKWSAQYGASRPLEIRVAPHRQLHDRLIVIDDLTVWNLSQSLNAFAKTAHASATIFPKDIADQKRAAYEDIWTEAKVV